LAVPIGNTREGIKIPCKIKGGALDTIPPEPIYVVGAGGADESTARIAVYFGLGFEDRRS
jgi:hypothetical protein